MWFSCDSIEPHKLILESETIPRSMCTKFWRLSGLSPDPAAHRYAVTAWAEAEPFQWSSLVVSLVSSDAKHESTGRTMPKIQTYSTQDVWLNVRYYEIMVLLDALGRGQKDMIEMGRNGTNQQWRLQSCKAMATCKSGRKPVDQKSKKWSGCNYTKVKDHCIMLYKGLQLRSNQIGYGLFTAQFSEREGEQQNEAKKMGFEECLVDPGWCYRSQKKFTEWWFRQASRILGLAWNWSLNGKHSGPMLTGLKTVKPATISIQQRTVYDPNFWSK